MCDVQKYYEKCGFNVFSDVTDLIIEMFACETVKLFV